MSFWIITGGLALVVAALLALTLRSRRGDGSAVPADYDLRVYRDQLREIERDLSRGVLSDGVAERVRAEVSRRILTADDARQRESAAAGEDASTSGLVVVAVALALIAGTFALYLQLGQPGYGDLSLEDRIRMAAEFRADRPSQAEAEAGLPPFQPPDDVEQSYLELVERLRDTVASRPDDIQGLTLLARNEANLGNFAAAARAQGEILRLKGDAADVKDLTDHADMLVLAAGGYVSPEAEAELEKVLTRDPGNGVARYYYGLMLAQTGRPDQAFGVWERLLRESPADALWVPPIRAQIEQLALRAGVDFRLPETARTPAPRGPDQADMAAAAEMTPEDRMEMIEGMVAGLSDRLATQGGPVDDWARLITALGVLGRNGEAATIYDEAVTVFAQDQTALDTLRRAGQKAGVAQ